MGTARTSPGRQLDALELITQQHDQIDALIDRLDDEDLSGADKRQVLHGLADHVAAHGLMEEQLFYPAVRARQREEILFGASAEHLAINRAMASLLGTPPGDERFEPRLLVLREEIEHHAREEEEDVLFPKVRRMMTSEELQSLGGEMQSLFDQLMSRLSSPMPREQATEMARPVPR